jgi:DNA-binding response OmpR family regulator
MSAPAPFKPAPLGAKVVLVVDDDPTIRTLVATTLAQAYAVYVADSAQNAMQVLVQIPTPNLVVCDVAMPAVDGIAFAKQMRSMPAFAQTPIIFLTAKTGPMDVIAGINAGARFYMTKPFNPQELVEKAKKAIGK